MAQAQHSLLLPERLAQVRDMLRASRVVRLDEVCVALGVSQATARRDLQDLERLGEARRVHGGAVAIGHPIGASGTRVLVTLIHALRAAGKRRGLATLCIGGGEASAVIVEVV